MDEINLLVIVTVISLFTSLLLAFFLITVKTKHKTSNCLFAFFLSLTALDLSEPLFNIVVDAPSNLGMLRSTFAFMQIPVFYLYIVSVCYSDFKLKAKHLLHLLPFIIGNAVLIPRFYTVDFISKVTFIENRQSMIELQFNHILIHIQIIAYFIAIFALLKKVKKLYLENYSGTSINSYKWMFQFSGVLTILYLIILVKNILKFSNYSEISNLLKIAVLLSQLFIICWYLLKALKHPHLFRTIDSKLQLVQHIIFEVKSNDNLIATEKKTS